VSIINEALKKAVREKEAGHSSGDRETVRRNIELEFQHKKSRFNWGPIFILLVIVLISGPIVAPIFSTWTKGGVDHTGGAKALASNPKANQKAQFAIEESPLFGSAPPAVILSKTPNFILSGIVYSPKESYCIINNEIVKVGDRIQGAKLLSVSQNSVRLDYRGKETALTLSNNT